jgi:predicted transcriptional regulator
MTTEVGLDERRKALRKFRKEAGLSQWELARMSGMGQAIISRFESGTRDLSPEALTRLEQAIADVLSGKQSAGQHREEAQKIATLSNSDSVKKLLYWFEDPKELQKHRLRIGLSEQEMAERAALDVSVVLEIESGKQPLSGEIAQSLWDVISDVESNGRDGLTPDERLKRYMDAKTIKEERDILAPLTEPTLKIYGGSTQRKLNF